MEEMKTRPVKNPLKQLATGPVEIVHDDSFMSLSLLTPASLVEVNEMPVCPQIEKLEIKQFPEIDYDDGDVDSDLTDLVLSKRFLNRQEILHRLAKDCVHDSEQLDKIAQAGAVNYLPFDKLESYVILRELFQRNPECAIDVDFDRMCRDGLPKFGPKILYLHSVLVQSFDKIGHLVFAPFYNHADAFMKSTLIDGYFRILRSLFDVDRSNCPTITEIFVSGLYSVNSDAIELSVRTICSLTDRVYVSSCIIDYQLEHFSHPEIFISLLLRQTPNPLYVRRLTNMLQYEAAVLLLCEIAEQEEGAEALASDLSWMTSKAALPIVLVLLKNPKYRQAIVSSPPYAALRNSMPHHP
jgi:hypothetical protein